MLLLTVAPQTDAEEAGKGPDTRPSSSGLKKQIPFDQEPIHRLYLPEEANRTDAGVGKFIIFSRDHIGKNWDFMASAWECIPSRPDTPVTKRIEFCHSSWNAVPLLDVLVADDTQDNFPRFVRLQVDSKEDHFDTNLYDIDYHTWETRCIWQGKRLSGFGVLKDAIFCDDSSEWFLLNTKTGQIEQPVPFRPQYVEGNYWVVTKPDDESKDDCFTYHRSEQKFVGRFRELERPLDGLLYSQLSRNGMSRVAIRIPAAPRDWSGGTLTGEMILQRHRQEDILVPVELLADPGSGRPFIPREIDLGITADGKACFTSLRKDAKNPFGVWKVDLSSGEILIEFLPKPPGPLVIAEDPSASLFYGVPVPEYLEEFLNRFGHFGRAGLAPAFLLHVGLLKEEPGYADCHASVSPDGKHILFAAKNGPREGKLIYGNTSTRQTVTWDFPEGLHPRAAMDFVWVETPE